MKQIIFLLSLLFVGLSTNAQNKTIPGSFIIKNLTDDNKLAFYTKAIEDANFEQYRLKEKNLILKFENGFELELLSAKQVFISNPTIVVSGYQVQYPDNYYMPTFSIAESGHITAVYNNPRKN